MIESIGRKIGLLLYSIFIATALGSSAILPHISQQVFAAGQSIDFLTYSNSAFGIKIQYPSSWEKELSSTGVVAIFYSPLQNDLDQYQDNVGIFIENTGKNSSLDQYAKDYMDEIKESVESLEIIKSEQTTLAGNPALKIVSIETVEGFDYETMCVFMIKDNTAYVIIYDAELANYSKYVAVAVKMLDSFEINIVEEVMEPAELVVYESSTYGVKIKHPSDWVAVEPEDKYIKAAFYSPFEGDSDLYAENIMILIETLPFNMKLADYTNLSINNMKKSVSDLEIIESGASALAGYAAHRIVFTFTIVDYEDINAKGMALWTIKDKKAYMIMYGAESGSYDKYLQTAQAMIDSFEIGH